MMRNLLPKIVLGTILVLLALHFLVSNVSVQSEGTWARPKFSFSLNKDGSSASAAPSKPTEASKAEKPVEPPSMWEDLEPSPDTTSVLATIASTAFTEAAEHTAHHSSAVVHSATSTTAHSTAHSAPTHEVNPHANHGDESELPCTHLPGAEDVVFIIKTGATELEERMPVHFNTTLRCFPKSLIFSDHGENYEGHIVHDALGQVIDEIRLEAKEFDLWRRLHEKGRAGLDPSELSINDKGSNLGGGGNPDNGGWALDKFKNIPMVNYTIHKYPDTKWFIYVDADTYIMWSTLLQWLQMMDSSKLVYLGSPAQIDGQVFGHGGSGYVISNALMHKAAEVYNHNQSYWDEFAKNHWAGDCVLATLLEEINGALSWAYPMIQGGDNNVMNFWETGYNRRLWCYPVISYHHIPPSTVASLWHFEQEWIANSSREIRHSDVYKQWYVPQLPHEREGWSNMVGLEDKDLTMTTSNDAWECRDQCQGNSTCMQWSFSGGDCRMLEWTKLGHAAEDVHSGWILDRINEKVVELDECDEGEWIMPDYHGSKRRMRARRGIEVDRRYTWSR
ncbi:hypothetical protein AMS68_003210 [Peltaster fructicola]|uniref:N-acetylgalactosaminide beta-1,3-galactosyltransferase n=1 Tax=Peltaster fructicola TaxID=286661 RepID=A0A6H0XSJ5_9PEZI|nr:hypothetical protein AMS68_003210 [Peltaster fructicola]